MMAAVSQGQGDEKASPQSAPTSPAPAQSTETAAQASFREALKKRNFQIPDSIQSDDDLADEIATMIDAANQLRSDDTFKDFQQHRNEFSEWRSKMSQQAEKPAATETPAKPAQKGLSKEAQLLRDNNMITKENGVYKASNPSLQQFADELNTHEARIRTASMKLVSAISEYDSPEEWIAAQVQAHLKTVQPESSDELKAIKAELDRERTEKRSAAVRSWVTENAQKLFIEGDHAKGLSEYGKAYQHYEQTAPESLQADPMERHEWILNMMKPVEALMAKAAEAQKPPEQPQQQARESFLGAAARRNNGHNRLSAYTGPADTQSTPTPVVGRGKMPTLASTIQQVFGNQ